MVHDFNKPPHVEGAEEKQQKRRLPVYILIVVGIFLAALIFYMFVDMNPSPGETSADPSIPAVSEHDSDRQQDTIGTAIDETTDAAKDKRDP